MLDADLLAGGDRDPVDEAPIMSGLKSSACHALGVPAMPTQKPAPDLRISGSPELRLPLARAITLSRGPRRVVRTTVWAAAIASASVALAQQSTDDTSANSVFLGCKAFTEGRAANAQLSMLGNFCSGVVHGLAGVGQYLSPLEWQSCVPANSTAQQLARVVITYIEAHPQRMHEDFRRLTLEAFHYAWPCKSSR